jgi:hypothetical protein
MRFRPLCIDYHAEALHLEEEQWRLSGEERPVIWIRNLDQTIPNESNNSNKDDTHIEPLDGNHFSSIDSAEPHTRKQNSLDVCETNDDQVSTTITPTSIKKRRRDPTGSISRVDDDNFVAVFKPPPAYLKWMNDNSVSWLPKCSGVTESGVGTNRFDASSLLFSHFL